MPTQNLLQKKKIGTLNHSTFNSLLKFKAGPPILVIFGRRALIFFDSSWKNMKNDTTFVRMRSGDHLEDAKMSKRAPCSVEFNFFISCDRQKQFSQNERRRAYLQKELPQIF